MTQLWACVPLTGMPKSRPARTFDVAPQPPTKAARDALMPPSMPWALRRPKSTTSSPRAARHTLAAFVAIRVSKFTTLRSIVSRIWAWRMGPRTLTSGSWGKTTVPSGTASTSHRSSSDSSSRRKAGSKSGRPSLPRKAAR